MVQTVAVHGGEGVNAEGLAELSRDADGEADDHLPGAGSRREADDAQHGQ